MSLLTSSSALALVCLYVIASPAVALPASPPSYQLCSLVKDAAADTRGELAADTEVLPCYQVVLNSGPRNVDNGSNNVFRGSGNVFNGNNNVLVGNNNVVNGNNNSIYGNNNVVNGSNRVVNGNNLVVN